MTPPREPRDPEALRERFRAAGQGHVFRFHDDLDEEGRGRLLASAAAVDLDLVARLAEGSHLSPPPPVPEPLGGELITRSEILDNRVRREEAAEAGLELLSRRKVGCVTVAGGQGTRLGFDLPKGFYPIGPGDRTLFDLHAESVAAMSRLAGRPVPWVIVVSPATEGETFARLAARGLPGVERTSIRIVGQGTYPALDDGGKLILEAPDRIAVAPDGHGGTFRALRLSGALPWLLNLGVEELSYFQVDNPLAPPADALFLGLHARARAQMSTKVFRKRDPAEKVGVVARLGGKPGVLEYTELPPELASRRGADGTLEFGYANMAAHVLSLPFAAAVAFRGLPVHRVRKKVPFVDDGGGRVEPREPNAWKFETFLFDALAHAARGVVLEVDRDSEFAPVKNAEGPDSPETCRALLQAAGRWPA